MRTAYGDSPLKKPRLRRLLEGLRLGTREASLLVVAMIFMSPGGPADAQVKREWVVTYDANEPSMNWRWDTMFGAGLDAAGNLHVAGEVMRPRPGGGGLHVSKVQTYGPRGNLLWDVENPQVPPILLGGCAVDSDGNTYIASGTGDGQDTDFLTLKYDPAGHLCWAGRRDFDGRNEGEFHIAVDQSGNVYAGGPSRAKEDWWAIVKYDSRGNEVWATMDKDIYWLDRFRVDSIGNVYAALSGPDYIVRKYDVDGRPVWTAGRGRPAHGIDTLWNLAFDAEGNVLLTGGGRGADGIEDCVTAKFSPDGEELWGARYDGPDRLQDWGWAVALDSTGNVYVTGVSEASEGWDGHTLKYDPEGHQVWTRRYPKCDGWVWRPPMAVDPAGNVYVALNVENKENQGITIIKYDREGNEMWEVSDLGVLTGGDVSWTWGAWLFVDDAYNVYFATTVWNGRASEGGTDGDFLIAKFSQGSPSFRRGDTTSDGVLQLTDPVFTLSYLFRAGPAPGCLDAADADDNGAIQITDAIFTLNHLFLGGPPLPAPTGSCGTDPSEDVLGCEAFPACP